MATVPRQRYDPSQQALTGDYRRSILEPVSQYTDAKRHTWLTVRLTAWGNARLWERCSTQLQREVWRYPCYEFVVRQNKITIKRIQSGRQSYVNALLIASRGKHLVAPCSKASRMTFPHTIRIPGVWDGACAGCKWPDGGMYCPLSNPAEGRWAPRDEDLAPIPVEDDDSDDDDEEETGSDITAETETETEADAQAQVSGSGNF